MRGNVIDAMPGINRRKYNRVKRAQKLDAIQREIHMLKLVLSNRWGHKL